MNGMERNGMMDRWMAGSLACWLPGWLAGWLAAWLGGWVDGGASQEKRPVKVNDGH